MRQLLLLHGEAGFAGGGGDAWSVEACGHHGGRRRWQHAPLPSRRKQAAAARDLSCGVGGVQPVMI
jgi:hypothetical protein